MQEHTNSVKEKWKWVVGYEGRYKVSTHGRVKSFNKCHKHKLMKLLLHHQGYLRVGLWNTKGQKRFLAHRLVALAFIPNKEKKNEVNHIDGNKKNNHVSNLEWCTAKENTKHAWHTGLFDGSKMGCKGSKHGMAKLNEDQVKIIRAIKKKNPDMFHKDIAKRFNISRATISCILGNKIWRHI